MRRLAEIPIAPGRLPLLGHALPLLRTPLAFLSELPQYGPLVRVRMGPAAVVVVCDPELTDQVLRRDALFDKGEPFYARARTFSGLNLGTSPHTAHRRKRRVLQPAFHPRRLAGHTEIMGREVDALTRRWQDGQVLDVPAEALRLSARILTATLLPDADDVREQALADVPAVLAGLFRQMVKPPGIDRIPTRGNREYQRAQSRLRAALGQVVRERRRTGRP